MTNVTPIPRPRPLPVLGNALEVHADTRLEDFMRLAREHWPIFELSAFGRSVVVVSSDELVEELCDESRFGKLVGPTLQALRPIAGNGLFTADTDDPVWRQAHHVLMPAFSPAAVRAMVPTMGDPLSQLLLKWARLNPGDVVDVATDTTRLTLETIGLCAFGYRFNSFYREEPHPFVRAMRVTANEAQRLLRRPDAVNRLDRVHQRRYEQAAASMHELVDTIIRARREAGIPEAPRDLLDHMLAGVDPETGERLSDENIRYQIVTFLVAGHETTGGLLTFTLYELVKNPEMLARAYEEVDRALGDDLSSLPSAEDLGKLGFVEQILKESLRLWPPAPAFFLHALEPTTIGGRYRVDRDTQLMVFSPMHHRDPAVWGESAERFDPDHFAPEREAALPPNAWKPFGNGIRACIGRHFAMVEATLALAAMLQRFEFVDHANYTLKVRWPATMRPTGFRLQVRPRKGRAVTAMIGVGAGEPGQARVEAPVGTLAASGEGAPLLVLYGSNLGTSEGIARRIAADAAAAGFAVTVGALDDYVEKLPREGAVIIVTSSYNGQPPDNAVRFVSWVANGLPADAFSGVRYAVFGCGDHNWAATFQAVPAKIDEALAARGATRIVDRGAADASDDFDGQFRAWYRTLWPQLAASLGIEAEPELGSEAERFEVEVLEHPGRYRFFDSIGAQALTVLRNDVLVQGGDGAGAVHLLELALPAGAVYRPGDHVAVLPLNDIRLISRAAARFGLPLEARIRLHATDARTQLPLDRPLILGELLAGFTELQEPATRAQIEVLAEWADSSSEQETLRALGGEEGIERYREEILEPRRSLVDLLEDFPSCQPPLDVFLSLLPELRPRFYSIASAPGGHPDRLSLVVGVVEGPARSGHGTYRGTCSSFLASQPPGATLFGFVRRPGIPFWPPEDPAVPMIMVATGTGLAPFRGFLQEREAQAGSRGPAFLFYGCRDARHHLFRDELDGYSKGGVATVETVYSHERGTPRVYVQERISERRDDLWALLEQGGVVYVCGHAAHVAPAVRQTFMDIYRERTNASEADAQRWLQGLRDDDRYLEDIWAAA